MLSMAILIILLVAVVLLSCWRPAWALWLTMSAAVLYDDRQLAESAVLTGEPVWPTIFNVRVAGLQIIDWCVAVLLAASLWRALGPGREKSFRLVKGIKWWSLPALIMVSLLPYVYSAVWGLVRGNSIYRLVQDLQNSCYLVALALCAMLLLDGPRQAKYTLRIFLAAMTAKMLLLLLRYWWGIGYIWENVFRFTISSDTVLLLIVIGWGIWRLADERPGWRRTIAWASLLAAALFIEFQIAGRTAMVLLIVQAALVALMLSGTRRRMFLASFVVLMTVTGLWLYLFRPQLGAFYWWRVKTIFQWHPDQTGKGGRLLSNSIKVLEYQNIEKSLTQSHTTLFGMGQGAYWKDEYYPINLPRINDAYAQGEKEHYSTHLQPLTQLLKMGWVGVVLHWAAMLAALLRLLQLATGKSRSRIVGYLLLALIPLSFNLSNYVRLYFFSGLFWGLAMLTERQLSEEK